VTEPRRPDRIAHAYGNSREAMARALDSGAGMIEADIWYRAGQVYVRHERRLGCLPFVADKTMRSHPPGRFSLRLGGRYYIRPDLKPRRLEDLLDETGDRAGLLLDTKGHYRPGERVNFALELANQVRERRAGSRVAVCGQNFDLLDYFRIVARDLEVRYSIEQPDQWRRLQWMVKSGQPVRRICIEHRFVDEDKAEYIREMGIHAYYCTVDDAGEAARLVDMGAAGIISNDLSLLAGLSRRERPSTPGRAGGSGARPSP
jgi:glycerophosphoryl diester phosphodiesterase